MLKIKKEKTLNNRSNLKQQAMALKSRPLKRLLFRFCGRYVSKLPMNIFIDESGSFVSANHSNAWNVVAAYVSPEADQRHLKQILSTVKVKSGNAYNVEIKLKNLTEAQYFDFLDDLNGLTGRVFCTATDSSLVNDQDILKHQKVQAEKVTEHKDKMVYKEGKEALEILKQQIENVSPQLYLQLFCQIVLITAIVERGILYFVQRRPKSLKKFSWKIDQKNTTKIEFEDAFEKITPPFLQSYSLQHSFKCLKGCDYSAMDDFFYTEENAPTYLNDCYGIETNPVGALNIGKLLKDDMKFEDSKQCIGIQIADLLASGLRRALRCEFNDNSKASKLLGQLMVQPFKGDWPLDLISFVDAPVNNANTANVIKTFNQYSAKMLV